MSFKLPLRCSTAYFKLPRTSVPRPLPATRITKRSFGPSLKINSTGTRASEQPRMAANGRCFGSVGSPAKSSQITRINKDNFFCPAVCVSHSFEECGKCLVAIVQTDVRGITIQWPRPSGCGLRSIPICNIHYVHISRDPDLKTPDACHIIRLCRRDYGSNVCFVPVADRSRAVARSQRSQIPSPPN